MKKNIKIALITGSNSSIGISIAKMLVKQDYFVYMNFNKNTHLIKNLKDAKISKIRADISKTSNIRRMFGKIKKKHNFINLLVLNATRLDERKKKLIFQKANYNKVLETNFFGHLEVVRNFIDFSKVKKKIFNISSDVSMYGSKNLPAYAASKSAFENILKSLSKTIDERSLEIFSFICGPVLTDKIFKTKSISWIKKNVYFKKSSSLTTYKISNKIKKILYAKSKSRFITIKM